PGTWAFAIQYAPGDESVLHTRVRISIFSFLASATAHFGGLVRWRLRSSKPPDPPAGVSDDAHRRARWVGRSASYLHSPARYVSVSPRVGDAAAASWQNPTVLLIIGHAIRTDRLGHRPGRGRRPAPVHAVPPRRLDGALRQHAHAGHARVDRNRWRIAP